MIPSSDSPSREATTRHVERFARHVGAHALRLLVTLAVESAARSCAAQAYKEPSRAPILTPRAKELWRLAADLRASGSFSTVERNSTDAPV